MLEIGDISNTSSIYQRRWSHEMARRLPPYAIVALQPFPGFLRTMRIPESHVPMARRAGWMVLITDSEMPPLTEAMRVALRAYQRFLKYGDTEREHDGYD